MSDREAFAGDSDLLRSKMPMPWTKCSPKTFTCSTRNRSVKSHVRLRNSFHGVSKRFLRVNQRTESEDQKEDETDRSKKSVRERISRHRWRVRGIRLRRQESEAETGEKRQQTKENKHRRETKIIILQVLLVGTRRETSLHPNFDASAENRREKTRRHVCPNL